MSVAKYLLRSFCKNMLYPALFQTHPQAYAHYDPAVSPPRRFTALPPAPFPWRVPKRFFGIRDFPYLKLRVRDFKAKSRKIRDWTLCAGVRMREINLRITGLKNPVSGTRHWDSGACAFPFTNSFLHQSFCEIYRFWLKSYWSFATFVKFATLQGVRHNWSHLNFTQFSATFLPDSVPFWPLHESILRSILHFHQIRHLIRGASAWYLIWIFANPLVNVRQMRPSRQICHFCQIHPFRQLLKKLSAS